MCVLDRILVSNDWEDKFNLSHVHTIVRIDFDHNKLLLDTDWLSVRPHYHFRFNASYLQHEGFVEWIIKKWPARFKKYSLDHWHLYPV